MDPEDERHGTPAGYKAHHALKEKPCDPCREAHNQRRNEHKRARRNRTESRCVVCGRTRRNDHADRGSKCQSCETAGNVRDTDLDIDFDPPTWVRRGLIWVAA